MFVSAATQPSTALQLPRLLVVSDVSVERSGAGSLLLYRLLESYPPARLKVFFSPHGSHGQDRQLAGVAYEPLPYTIPRYIQNRFDPFWPVVMSLRMGPHARKVLASLGDFSPDAVISVAHGFLWFAAAIVANERGLPLHLFMHDDWAQFVTHNRAGRIWDVVRRVGRVRARTVLRRSASRFSVSPGMAEEMSRTFGVSSTLIYPHRGSDSPEVRVRRRTRGQRPPVLVHTGFVHTSGNADLLRKVARMMGQLGGHLDLYTLQSDAELAYHGLVPPIVRNVGFFPADEMAERIGTSADALFLSASFEENHRIDASTLFPSKLADYTAVGLPILIWGPEYSSASRWSIENPGATVLVATPDSAAFERELRRLLADEGHAERVARAGVEAGSRYFELTVASERFLRSICSA
jgi:glycosyltransferase involved in cell wall biosynthesis